MVFLRSLLVLGALFALACNKPAKVAPVDTGVASAADEYFVGSVACQGCHEKAQAAWAETWMARTVREPTPEEIAHIANSILCGGMQVDLVLGGRINLRYLQKRGDDYIFLPCEYSAVTKRVEPFRIDDWQTFSFTEKCAACHTTHFEPDKGEWLELGVGCESCHGPASRHGDYKTAGGTVQFGKISALEESMICSSCHLQGGFSKKSDRRYPEGYVVGMHLFDLYTFDWASLEAATASTTTNPIDVHQKILVKANLEGESLRCGDCHTVHPVSDEKHKQVPQQAYCDHCHYTDDSGQLKLKNYTVECPVCEF